VRRLDRFAQARHHAPRAGFRTQLQQGLRGPSPPAFGDLKISTVVASSTDRRNVDDIFWL